MKREVLAVGQARLTPEPSSYCDIFWGGEEALPGHVGGVSRSWSCEMRAQLPSTSG